MDGSFPYAQWSYERSRPVFLELELDARPVVDPGGTPFLPEEEDLASSVLQRCYESVLLVTAARLPQPALSVTYLVTDGDDLDEETRRYARSSQVRRVGAAERELIVHGDQHIWFELEPPDLVELIRTWSLLELSDGALTPFLEALIRTTRPGFTPLNEALHLVQGLEALLVARGEPLTTTFARRFSALLDPEDPQAHNDLGRDLYKLRSSLVHGRPLPPDPTGTRETFLQHSQRDLACRVAEQALALLVRGGGGVRDLRAAADRIWAEHPPTHREGDLSDV